MMNKKILSVLALLLIVASVAVGYIALNQPVTQQSSKSSGTFTPSDIAGEINNSFLNETQDITIGEMV